MGLRTGLANNKNKSSSCFFLAINHWPSGGGHHEDAGFCKNSKKIWNVTNCVIDHTWLRDSFANHRVLCGPLPYIPRNGWCYLGSDAGRCWLRDALRIPIEAFVSTRSRARSQGNSRWRRMHFKHQDRYYALLSNLRKFGPFLTSFRKFILMLVCYYVCRES